MVSKTVVCRDKDNNRTEVPAEKLVFRPSIYGVIVRDDAVLLGRAWDGYDFPGGAVELGESLSEALVREVKEETGLAVDVGPLVLVTEDFFTSFAAPDLHFHSLLYFHACNNPRGEISADGFHGLENEYMQAAEWVPLEKIDSIKFYNGIDSPALIRAVIDGKKHI